MEIIEKGASFLAPLFVLSPHIAYGAIIYYIIGHEADCAAGAICYDDNGAESATKMSDQSASSNASVTLLAQNFKRSRYGFAGWNTRADGSGTNYGPNQTITTGDLSSKGLRLYAMWIASAGNLQNWQGCDSLTQGEVTALTDTRDGETYAVSKLADGACWMVENLRLSSSAELSTLNTDNPSLPITNVYGEETSNRLSASSIGWCTGTSANCNDQSLLNTDNVASAIETASVANSNIYGYGAYYNWYSATAGRGTTAFNVNDADVSGNICPTGWTLPVGGSNTKNGDFYRLAVAAIGTEPTAGSDPRKYYDTETASNAIRSYPYNFVYAGALIGNNITSRGTAGTYWSSTTQGSASAYFADVYATQVKPGGSIYYKNYGRSVRCIEIPVYYVNYDANGGTGTMTTQAIKLDVATNLNAHKFYRSGYVFNGWNTEADGTGTHYNDKESVINITSERDGHVTLYAQWAEKTCGPNTICYDGNGADNELAMGDQAQDDTDLNDVVTVASNTGITLWATNYKRDGYGFAGWNTRSDGLGIMYGPNEKITTGDLSEAGLQLYATWIASAGDLQGFTGCSAMAISEVTALTDTRDNETYAVAKLADGACWIIENLRFAGTDTLTSENTNEPVSGFALGDSTSAWCSTADVACVDTPLINTANLQNTESAMTTGRNANVYGYGVYYNWNAVTAGNGTYAFVGTVAGDICPAGWQLPRGGTGAGSFGALAQAMTGGTVAANWMKYPYNIVYSGGLSGSSIAARGAQNFYYSATATGANAVSRLYVTTASINYTGTTGKNAGRTARCVMK